jgi:SAM-dependent methyltransferase
VHAPSLIEFAACPVCYESLTSGGTSVTCAGCATEFPIDDGIPILLPPHDDDVRRRYQETYQEIAAADLDEPLETMREARHERLLDFIGDVRSARVLDVGSSYAGYLRRLDARFKVAFDIALPYLRSIPREERLAVVCGDAEHLPFRPGAFDVIVISDVLEHLLEPEALVARITAISTPQTRVIVEVPWEEDLSSYGKRWEFEHLRSFDLYSFSTLWARFRIARMRSSIPRLDVPVFLSGQMRLPLALLNRLRVVYYYRGLAQAEYEWRARRLRSLPAGDRYLLRFSRPLVRQFELRLFDSKDVSGQRRRLTDRALTGAMRWLIR